MLNSTSSSKFDHDVELVKKRGWPMANLITILGILILEIPIPASYKDHPLKGKWVGYRELHLKPDWILIYKIDKGNLFFARTGRHVDVFDNY